MSVDRERVSERERVRETCRERERCYYIDRYTEERR